MVDIFNIQKRQKYQVGYYSCRIKYMGKLSCGTRKLPERTTKDIFGILFGFDFVFHIKLQNQIDLTYLLSTLALKFL